MPDLSGNNPWSVERVLLSSTTDWVAYVAATWVRFVTVRNEHASEPMYVGNPGSTGTFNATTSEYITVAAGASITIPLGAIPATSHRTIAVASATASHPVALVQTQE